MYNLESPPDMTLAPWAALLLEKILFVIVIEADNAIMTHSLLLVKVLLIISYEELTVIMTPAKAALLLVKILATMNLNFGFKRCYDSTEIPSTVSGESCVTDTKRV